MLMVAVIGTGGVAENHLKALRKLPDVSIAGVCDIVPDRAQKAATAYGAERWTVDYQELLADDGVDAVSICTINHLHGQIALEAIRQGKHVLVEKPLVTRLGEGHALLAAATASGLSVMGAHTHRFYRYSRAIKEVIESGDIGRPVMVEYVSLGGFWNADWTTWQIHPEWSGGHVLHNGVHLMDLMNWYMGQQPVTVYAMGQKNTNRHLEIWDYFHVQIRYPSGMAGFEISRGNVPRQSPWREITVMGTEGQMRVDSSMENMVTLGDGGMHHLSLDYQEGFDRELAEWVGSIVEGRRSAVPVEEAFLAVRMAIAAERSLAEGREVHLEEVAGS